MLLMLVVPPLLLHLPMLLLLLLTVQHFRKACEVLHLAHCNPCSLNGLCTASCGHQLITCCRKTLRKHKTVQCSTTNTVVNGTSRSTQHTRHSIQQASHGD